MVRVMVESFRLVSFLDDLTNWYIRMNRDRMRGGIDMQNTLESLNTLYDVSKWHLFTAERSFFRLGPA